MVQGAEHEILARLSARLDAQEEELVALRAAMARLQAAERTIAPVAGHTVPSMWAEGDGPSSRRTATASRRTLLKGAGVTLFTTALLATGEIVPVTPLTVTAAAPPDRPTGTSSPAVTTPDTLYQTFVGTDFQPEITADGYSNLFTANQFGGGPVYQSTGFPANFSARVHLPQGATITEVIFYVVHNDANPMFVDMARYPLNTNAVSSIGSANPSGNNINVQAISLPSLSNTTVDNSAYSYVLEWFPGTVGTYQQLYAARVGYTFPGLAQVYGNAQAGSGVRGDSATGTGVVGNAAGTGTVAGVLGSTNATLLADQRAGVAGMSNVAGVPAVYGHATVGDTAGVFGSGANKGAGIYGISSTTVGVGVLGQGDVAGGVGVKGVSAAGFPIIGGVSGSGSATNTAAGVLGVGTAGPGVQGQSNGHGLVGTTFATDGQHAALIGSVQSGGNAIALRGSIPPGATGLAGVFDGDVIINGALRVFGSPKNAAVKHPTDNTYRLLYCMESPESWFEDFGKAKLVNGHAEVRLDMDFAALVHADDYYVFLTSHDPASQGLAVAGMRADGFAVQEHAGGTSSGTFSYRVVARRKDIAGERLAKVASPPPLKAVTPFTVSEIPAAKPPITKP